MISEKTHIGISEATSSTQSNSACSNAAARMPRASPLIRSSYVLTTRGVKPLLTIARSRVCGGGSVSIIDFRASISSGVRSWSDVPPSSEENVSQSFETCDDVVVARERPEAAALPLRLPVQRRLAAQQREPVVRHASLPDVEVGEVDRRRARGRPGDGPATVAATRHVRRYAVLARVRGLLGGRRRREPHEQRAAGSRAS